MGNPQIKHFSVKEIFQRQKISKSSIVKKNSFNAFFGEISVSNQLVKTISE